MLIGVARTSATAIAALVAVVVLWLTWGSDGRDVRVRSLLFISTDGRSLTVALDSCDAEPVLEIVEEGPERVVLAATADRRDAGDCADIGLIRLHDPLWDRALIDGSTGQDLSRDGVRVSSGPAD